MAYCLEFYSQIFNQIKTKSLNYLLVINKNFFEKTNAEIRKIHIFILLIFV